MKRASRFDTLLTGLLPGILVPVVTFFVILATRYDRDFGRLIVEFQQMGILSKIVSLSVIPNLLLFFVFTWLNMNNSAKGVIFATFIVAFVMLILKFS
ncbi:MAG: hypothetical protein JXR52_10835 [Bacteroidales bacterium]|nr:hypothetical protein [Bacteroidales bacterium]